MVATTFGLARYGYGLLLPDIRRSFHLSSTSLGLIATGSYAAYLLGTAGMATGGDRAGPRRPVLIGGVCACAGVVLIAVASSPVVLAAGGVVAGVGAAVAYSPFSGAGARALARRGGGGDGGGRERRDRLSAVLGSGCPGAAAAGAGEGTVDHQLRDRLGSGRRGAHRARGRDELALRVGRIRRRRAARHGPGRCGAARH